MSLNLRQIRKAIQSDIMANNAVIVLGPPGFGKTDMMTLVFQWFRAKHKGKRVGLSTFFMATQSVVGLTGLPWKGEKDFGDGQMTTVTTPAVPQWCLALDPDTGKRLPVWMFDLVLLIIEEWGQGNEETKRGGAEVLLHGGTPPWFMPPGSARVALSNTDVRDGVTKEYDFIIHRRSQYTLHGDIKCWLEDFADRPYSFGGREWLTLPIVKHWAQQNTGIVFPVQKPKEQGPACNPRTLCMADRQIQVIKEDNNGVIPVNDPWFHECISGKIGMDAATSLIGHVQFSVELPSYEQVITDPEHTPIPKKADLLMLQAYELAHRAQPDDIVPLITYVQRMAKERSEDMGVTFVSSLMRRDYKSFFGLPAVQGWIAKNSRLVTLINMAINPE